MKLSLIGSLGCAYALGNTAPFLFISGTQDVPRPNAAAVGDLEAGLAEQLASCRYDSYIFAAVSGVSERSFNQETMPQLSHLLERAAEHHYVPAVADFAQYEARAESTVRSVCGAQDVTVGADGSYELYSDLGPRIFELDLGSDAAEADRALSHVLGHLPSSNFVVVLRSTPPAAGTESVTASAAPKKAESNLFTDYVFFSPGLFMGIIISALVGSVMLIALGWLQSLLVSYKAFEKQPEKSN